MLRYISGGFHVYTHDTVFLDQCFEEIGFETQNLRQFENTFYMCMCRQKREVNWLDLSAASK